MAEPALTWSPAFELGVAELDADHRKLVELVNRAAADDDDSGFAATVAEFHRLLRAHAPRERKFLHAKHAAEYDAALERAEAFFSRLSGDSGRDIPRPLIRDFMRHWLLDHIVVGDLAARDRLIAEGRLAAEPAPALSRLKIGRRIWLVAVVPLVLLLLMAGTIAVDRFGDALALDRIATLARSSAVIGDTVHALQKERGASAGFLNSKGKAFADEMRAFRNQSDAALAAFDRAAAEATELGLGERTERARRAVAELAALRGRVDAFSVSVPDEVAAYTGMVQAMLAMIDGVADLSPDEEIARDLSAFAVFLHGKDLAGVERARGSAGFGAGRFGATLYRDFAEIAGQQSANFRIAQRMLSRGMRDPVVAALASPTDRKSVV